MKYVYVWKFFVSDFLSLTFCTEVVQVELISPLFVVAKSLFKVFSRLIVSAVSQPVLQQFTSKKSTGSFDAAVFSVSWCIFS